MATSLQCKVITLYSLHLTLYTLHFTPYTLHLTLYTLHSTPYTLYLTPLTKQNGTSESTIRIYHPNPQLAG